MCLVIPLRQKKITQQAPLAGPSQASTRKLWPRDRGLSRESWAATVALSGPGPGPALLVQEHLRARGQAQETGPRQEPEPGPLPGPEPLQVPGPGQGQVPGIPPGRERAPDPEPEEHQLWWW